MKLRLLGGMTPRIFLKRHWQKRALFVRGALPQLPKIVSAGALAALATRDDVESRMVMRRGRRRETRSGPFAKVVAKRTDWTLLVNGVNLHVPAADQLLQRFDFVPQARLDDVMVSYATPGGGVGPHVDSYDVFLLQGPGRRRWTVEGRRYLAEPGDLLYLPPGLRHDGVALEPCFTYSIGFRAPRGTELGAAFLDWLHERGLPDASYRDPGLAPARRPGEIPRQLLSFGENLLRRIRWSRGDVVRFLGEYLSEPKPHVVFAPGRRGPPLARALVRLDPKTRLLYRGACFFINGESVGVSSPALRVLADRRMAQGADLARAKLGGLISQWQRLGYVTLQRI
jgi:50S ribosomal protein L16 3-hydroxylase